jgi:hypothetical protein
MIFYRVQSICYFLLEFFKSLWSYGSTAHRTSGILLDPVIDTLRVEVMVHIAGERGYVIIWTELTHAD